CFFSRYSVGGLCDWGILLVIPLEFQENKASTVFYDTVFRFGLSSRPEEGKTRDEGLLVFI
ncbi:hypothetical protein, partial [Bilophila sp.]|uniref:hypothetical protein n=1 Tax=Bilophila sp. TaxID=1929485 RepID=UPI003076C7CF